MTKVSVIVPVHNAGSYLKECLDSLHAQTLQELEVLFILDCPTDGSDVLVQQYSEKDSRFVVITNDKNLHIGNSRNKGISLAKGQFIAFCDHDDIMEPKMYERLYDEAIAQNADIILSQPAIEEEGIRQIWDTPSLKEDNIQQQILSDLISSGGEKQNISKFCNIHNVLYRLALVKEFSIRFVDTFTTTPEDVLFNIETIYHAKKVIFLPIPLYYHRIIVESTGHKKNYLGWESRYNGVNYVYSWLLQNDLFTSCRFDFYLMAQKKIIDGILSTIANKRGFSAFKEAYKAARSYPFTRDTFKHYRDGQRRPILKKTVRRLLAYSLAL